ncbi:hypothetical protein QFZ28_000750 [Neobacillus niacini]|uniref:hypothetical protein n=1 Tax=Neobacillus niacini TaxID=86668 RepID=UPI00278B770F|nr:hypothetical protein [Neobacillus niacini]MDQ1000350.1 hypothetical protein [Neobacillus niacini]
MQTNLTILNPFTFKTSMDIALEVTFPVLASETHENLMCVVKRVPNYLRAETLTTTSEEKNQLKECIQAFKQSKTCSWIREDFLQALNDIERQC